MKYFIFIFIAFLLILSFSCLPGCADVSPRKVLFEIHEPPPQEMMIINNPNGTQSIRPRVKTS